MDPFRNPALHSAKLQSLFSSHTTHREADDMPAPPAYHMVVDRNEPTSDVRSSYDDVDEDDKDEEDVPEIVINAATQIRGHGNIISIAQMDSAKIASLISGMMNGVQSPDSQATSIPSPAPSEEATPKKPFPRINITVNCGATIIGDRNIVGPGLGDIARQMQMAQRNQVLQAQQAQQQQQAQQHLSQQRPQQQSPPAFRMSPPPSKSRETLYQAQAAIAQHHGTLYAAQGLLGLHVPTPPMSRSSSAQSEGATGTKRKAESEVAESAAKKQC
jgi:hypothetical protein